MDVHRFDEHSCVVPEIVIDCFDKSYLKKKKILEPRDKPVVPLNSVSQFCVGSEPNVHFPGGLFATCMHCSPIVHLMLEDQIQDIPQYFFL